MARSKKTAKDAETVSQSEEQAEEATEAVLDSADSEETTPDVQADVIVDVHPVAEPNMPKPRSGGTFLPLVAGGIVAAGLGFAASQYLANPNWPFQKTPDMTADLRQDLLAQANDLASIKAQIADLSAKVAAPQSDTRIDDLMGSVENLTTGVTGVEETVTALNRRLTDLEGRPIPDVGATAEAVQAYESQLAAMRSMLDQELAQIKNAQTEALAANTAVEESTASIRFLSAVSNLTAAANAGGSYSTSLDVLAALATDIPDVLVENADTGIATMPVLRNEFPAFAREAMIASIKEQEANGEISKTAAFFQTQFGIRSLEPKEGTSADAILSRAEDALRNGDIAQTLSELQALPDTGREVMAPWVQKAQTRENVMSAIAEISENSGK